MFRLNANYLIVFAIILSGCAQHPDTLSVRHKQAMERANQGEKAYLNGNVEQSRLHYQAALQLNTRIENARGIAANTLSLAQIQIDSGEYDQADAALRLISENKNQLFTDGERADAAARSALLALFLKQPGRAAELAQQAQTLCRDCIGLPAILNLRARSAYTLELIQDSDDLARQAGVVAEKMAQPGELANSRRLSGEIQLHLKSAAAAVPLLEQALLLDKQGGQAVKIAEDLHFLAEAKDRLGLPEEAESLRGRERAIRQALDAK